MPRQPRAEVEPGVYHVFSRGNRKQDIYRDDDDRRRYLLLLSRAVFRMRWRCLSYCLMGNHVHMLVETRTPNLGAGMHRLHGMYAQSFNSRHTTVGHLFQHRYKANPVLTDEQLWITAAYIANNPVEAGLCRTPEDWTWSSFSAVTTDTSPTWLDEGRLLDFFASQGGSGRERYRSFVQAYATVKKPSRQARGER
jgi:putative transposase